MRLDTDAADCSIEDGIRRGLAFVADRRAIGKDWPSGADDLHDERLYPLVILYHFLAGTDDSHAPAIEQLDAHESSVIHLLLPTDPSR